MDPDSVVSVCVDWTHRGEDGKLRGLMSFAVDWGAEEALRTAGIVPQFQLTRENPGEVSVFNDYGTEPFSACGSLPEVAGQAVRWCFDAPVPVRLAEHDETAGGA